MVKIVNYSNAIDLKQYFYNIFKFIWIWIWEETLMYLTTNIINCSLKHNYSNHTNIVGILLKSKYLLLKMP